MHFYIQSNINLTLFFALTLIQQAKNIIDQILMRTWDDVINTEMNLGSLCPDARTA